ncbi:MAG: hypothetical protein ACRETW_02890 [Stenotrophobium sp.]
MTKGVRRNMSRYVKAAVEDQSNLRQHQILAGRKAAQDVNNLIAYCDESDPESVMQYLEQAEAQFSRATSTGAFKEGMVYLFWAATAAQNTALKTQIVKQLLPEMRDAVFHFRDRSRESNIQLSVGLCSRCYRLSSQRRGQRYLCQLHRGGGANAEAQRATKQFRKYGAAIRDAERSLLLLLCDTKRPDTDTIWIQTTGDNREVQIRQMKVRAEFAEGEERYFSHALRHAGVEGLADAALKLGLDGNTNINAIHPDALHLITHDHYWSLLILTRAEALFTNGRVLDIV